MKPTGDDTPRRNKIPAASCSLHVVPNVPEEDGVRLLNRLCLKNLAGIVGGNNRRKLRFCEGLITLRGILNETESNREVVTATSILQRSKKREAIASPQ